MNTTTVLFGLLPLSIILHNIEEFVYPGGFLDWYKKYKPEIADSINPKILAITNILLIGGSLNSILNNESVLTIILWLAFASIVGINIFYHIQGSFLTKSYSPGLITSLIVYLPLVIYGYYYFLSTGKITAWIAVLCSLTGILSQILLYYNHKRRVRKMNFLNK